MKSSLMLLTFLAAASAFTGCNGDANPVVSVTASPNGSDTLKPEVDETPDSRTKPNASETRDAALVGVHTSDGVCPSDYPVAVYEDNELRANGAKLKIEVKKADSPRWSQHVTYPRPGVSAFGGREDFFLHLRICRSLDDASGGERCFDPTAADQTVTYRTVFDDLSGGEHRDGTYFTADQAFKRFTADDGFLICANDRAGVALVNPLSKRARKILPDFHPTGERTTAQDLEQTLFDAMLDRKFIDYDTGRLYKNIESSFTAHRIAMVHAHEAMWNKPKRPEADAILNSVDEVTRQLGQDVGALQGDFTYETSVSGLRGKWFAAVTTPGTDEEAGSLVIEGYMESIDRAIRWTCTPNSDDQQTDGWKCRIPEAASGRVGPRYFVALPDHRVGLVALNDTNDGVDRIVYEAVIGRAFVVGKTNPKPVEKPTRKRSK